ncbi:MAG TPA: hypothetical protein VLI90_01975, partial [Tepidisphaeraceae bacterium]|nr:hypothetical protein [Tepidisphaeraceae bacterium]
QRGQEGRGLRGGGGGLRGTAQQDANQQPSQQQPDDQQQQQPQEAAQNSQRGGQRAGQQQANAGNRNIDGGDDQANPTRGFGGAGGNANHGPLTGEDYRDWSDRLRDVEEMVSDPRLRAEAARIRERARDVRIEFKRHSLPPNWNTVDLQLGQPLAQLRDEVDQELLRHESKDALVPIDRDAVPPEYAEQVRQYYERLGSGR